MRNGFLNEELGIRNEECFFINEEEALGMRNEKL